MELVSDNFYLSPGQLKRIDSLGWNKKDYYSSYVLCFGVYSTSPIGVDTKSIFNMNSNHEVALRMAKVYPYRYEEMLYYALMDKYERDKYMSIWLRDYWFNTHWHWFIYDLEKREYEEYSLNKFDDVYWDVQANMVEKQGIDI